MPSDNLVRNYWRLYREFRCRDLPAFCDQHEQLFQAAVASGDHLAVTRHYYDMMASLIAAYYGDGWHFCPPEHSGQSRMAATHALYQRVSEMLQLAADKSALDIGCGVGGMLRYVAGHSGASLTGITLGTREVEQGNDLLTQVGLNSRCRIVQGDSQAMPFEAATFDAAYAVYALKYYPKLDGVFQEVHRVLKPNGRFVAYCLCKSRQYDENNTQHRRLLQAFEYSTGMPSLHTVDGIIAAAERNGMGCIEETDLSEDERTWYAYWVRNPLLPWLVSSRLIAMLTHTAEACRLLPRGFSRFNDTFLAGTVRHIIRGGQKGILTGSALLTFQRR